MKFGIRELLFLCVMIGLVAVSYFRIIVRKQAECVALEQDTAEMVDRLGRLNEATAGIDDLSRKIDDLQKAITFFESKLPQAKEVDKILKEVWQIAEANALSTKTIRTLKSERCANYSEQPIQMSLSGDFDGYYAFLLQLEKLPRITRITKMNLEKITDVEGEMEAQMTLSIFFEPDTNAIASVN